MFFLYNKAGDLMKNKIIYLIVFVVLLLIILLSLFKIISRINDNNRINDEMEIINKNVIIKETDDSENVQIIDNTDNTKDNYYWNFIKMNLIDVDFNKLKKINGDTAGWVYVGGTNINYPVVQTSNNQFYLNHSFTKVKNKAGWVFFDYRNNINSFDKNTIIYAHDRLDNTMFGTLSDTLKDEWFNDYNNHVVKISTENENSLWQIFSIYHIKTNNDYTQIIFKDNSEFMAFINTITKRSYYNFNTDISFDDKILTLSTCYKGDNEKMVLHAKLIKKEIR